MAVKKTTTGNNKIYLFAGAILLGVAGYFGYKWYKKRKDTNNGSSDTTLTPPVETAITEVKTPTGTTTVIASSNPFKTKDEVLKFQQWVINTKKDKTILGGGGSTGFGDDGSWGGKSASAWDKYGKEYLTGSGTGATSGTPASTKDMDLIIKYCQGERAERSWLQKTMPDFVTTWASRLRTNIEQNNTKKAVFIWKNQAYSTYTGVRVWESNPIGKTATPKATGVYGFKLPDTTSGSIKIDSWATLGKIQSLAYFYPLNILFAYMPDNSSIYKWYPVNQLKF
jgi:hypothetical protein